MWCICLFAAWEIFPGGIWNWPFYMENKERWKKEPRIPDWEALSGSREAYRGGSLWWLQGESLPTPACQNPTSLSKGIKWIQSCIPSRWSQQPLALSRLCPWNSCWCRNTWKNIHSKHRGGGGASDCLGPAHGSTGGHILSMAFSSSIVVAVGSVEDSIA